MRHKGHQLASRSESVRIKPDPGDKNSEEVSILVTTSPFNFSPVRSRTEPAGECTSAARVRPRSSMPISRNVKLADGGGVCVKAGGLSWQWIEDEA